MVEAIGYLLIFLLFFGIPLAIVLYGVGVAIRQGRSPGNTQEMEKSSPEAVDVQDTSIPIERSSSEREEPPKVA